MSESISNRHRGNLGGKFTDSRLPAKVTVMIADEIAGYRTAQHLLWMLVNLLARQPDEIQEIELIVPKGIIPKERLSPLISISTNLDLALREGMHQLHPGVVIPKDTVRSHVYVRVGPGPLGEADLSLATTAWGWSGYIGRTPTDCIGEDNHPIGAYIAASLCAGEIFKFVRGMLPTAGTLAPEVWLNAFLFEVSEQKPSVRGPDIPDQLLLHPAVIAGIGAVANGMLHTLYPISGLRGELTLIDNDAKGITKDNLNRYVLFGLLHLSALKATTVSRIFAESGISCVPVDDSWQVWSSQRSGRPLDLVISAVDNNQTRHDIQAALPRLILAGSTHEMRAEINLYDVHHGSPCLRCYNRVEEAPADEAIIAQLKALPASNRRSYAERVGVDASILEEFLADPHQHCGKISGEALRKFASSDIEGEWSVGFVSLLAGVLLAAEYLKLSIDATHMTLNAQHCAFKFQFWRPESTEVNKVYGNRPEAGCFCQSPIFQHALKGTLL